MNTLRDATRDNCMVMDDSKLDWLIVIATNRDADLLTQSNWQAMLTRLGGESETVSIAHFGHWACGWVDYLLVAPNDADKRNVADALRSDLEQYSLLDEDDYSHRQTDYAMALWLDLDAEDRRDYLKRAHIPTRYARNKHAPLHLDTTGSLYELLTVDA